MIEKQQHWTNYWRSGNLTSLPQDFAQNYDGEIGTFWSEIFQSLDNGSSILDLCTGNGAIALLAAQFSLSNQANFKVLGVDAAKVDKSSILKTHTSIKAALDQVSFISNCFVEEIDLPKASQDLITSQYGIEYCNWEKTAKKVKALLKPKGKLVFISHAPSTSILAFMKVEQKQYAYLNEIKLFSCLDNYFANKTSAGNTLKKLNAVKNKLQFQNQIEPSQLFGNVMQFLQHVTNLNSKEFKSEHARVQGYYQQHLFAFQRLQDILNVSEKIMKDSDWYSVFERHGLKLIETGDIIQAGQHNAGRYFHFEND